MVKRFQGFIAGVIITSLILLNITVFAEPINAIFNSINIIVNGAKVASIGDNYTLSNSEEIPYSLSYKGTTYLPMRKLAELLGKEVTWDNNTKTAIINDKTIAVPDSTPVPSEGVTKEQLGRFFVQSLDLKDDNAVSSFIDVPSTSEYYKDISIISNKGLINGVGSMFLPKQITTRQQYASYLCKALKLYPIDYEDINITIKDIRSCPMWAQLDVKIVLHLGLMELDAYGNFNPDKPLEMELIPNKELQKFLSDHITPSTSITSSLLKPVIIDGKEYITFGQFSDAYYDKGYILQNTGNNLFRFYYKWNGVQKTLLTGIKVFIQNDEYYLDYDFYKERLLPLISNYK